MLALGKTIGQVVQALEISEQTFHRWRKQYLMLDKDIFKEALEENY